MEEDTHARIRIAALERKVSQLYEHLGIPEPGDRIGISPEAQQALDAGNMIQAIKIVREQTGMGLAEAKALIEGTAGAASPRIIE
jgi:large subunit ribosomal protein L7/L12